MRKMQLGGFAIKALALLALLGLAHQVMAQQSKSKQVMAPPGMMQQATTTYSKMAPLDQYLITDRAAEIALARTAAPESISRDAEILVLGPHGFESAVKGKNGFVCLVERSWTSAPDPDYWNPKVRTPICFNPAAAHSYLLRDMKRTAMGLAGRPQTQVDAAIFAAVANKELPPMASGAMCYMMSKEGNGGDSIKHWPPHLMFYFSNTPPATWGAGLPGSPIFATADSREHLTEFVIAVQHWSDGTEPH